MNKIREEIDEIDDAMRILFEKRMDCVRKVIAYKIKNHMEIKDENREVRMIEKNLKKLKNPKYQKAYECFLRDIIKGSIAFQETWLSQKKNKE